MESPSQDWEEAENQRFVYCNFMESGKAARTAGRGATAAGLAERNTRLDAEHLLSGGPDAWRHVYNLLRCLGPLCNLGPYC